MSFNKDFIQCHHNQVSGVKLDRILIVKDKITSIEEPENKNGCIIYINTHAIPVKESFDSVINLMGATWFEKGK